MGTALLFAALVSGVPEQATDPSAARRWPGELRAVALGGSTLHSAPHARVGGGVWWHPFPLDAWAGLAQVGAGAQLELGVRSRPYGALHAWVSYGRPRPGLWAAFDAGVAAAGGRGETTAFAILISSLAAVRLGFGPIAIRIAGYITSRRAVVEGHYYSMSLEWAWLL